MCFNDIILIWIERKEKYFTFFGISYLPEFFAIHLIQCRSSSCWHLMNFSLHWLDMFSKKRNNIYIFMCSITRNFQHMYRLIFKNKTIMLSGIITEIIFNRTVFLFFDTLFISWVRRDCCLMKVILFLSCVVMSWNLVQILHFDTIF